MVTRRVKLGIVGCGRVALGDYFPAFEQDYLREQAELVAVCDAVPERAQKIGEQYGAREIWTSYEDMLAHTAAEALLLLTPIPLHFGQASAAIAAGKHVYVQKTMTTSYAEARELVRQAGHQGVLLCAAPGQMLNPAHRRARELIESGVLGKLCFARAQGSHHGHENVPDRPTDPYWYYQPGGGPLRDVGVYPLHSLTGMLGPVQRVTAFSGIVLPQRTYRGTPFAVQMDDSSLLLLDFGEAVFAQVDSTYCKRARTGAPIELYCERGQINLALWMSAKSPIRVYAAEDVPGFRAGWTEPDVSMPPMKHTVADLVHFAECVRDGRQPVHSAAHAAHVIEVIDKAYAAAQTGQAQVVASRF